MAEIDNATIKLEGDASGFVKAATEAKQEIADIKAEAERLNKITEGATSLPDRVKASELAGTSVNNISETAASYATITSGAIDATKSVSFLTKSMNIARGASAAMSGNIIGAAGALTRFGGGLTAIVAPFALVLGLFDKWRDKLDAAQKKLADVRLESLRFSQTFGVSEDAKVAQLKTLDELAAALDNIENKYSDLTQEAGSKLLDGTKAGADAYDEAFRTIDAQRLRERAVLEKRINSEIAKNEGENRRAGINARKAARDKEDAEAKEARTKAIAEEKTLRESVADEANSAEDANRIARLSGLQRLKEQELQAIKEINLRRIASNAEGVDDYFKRLIDAAREAAKIQAEEFAKAQTAALKQVFRSINDEARAASNLDAFVALGNDIRGLLEAIERQRRD